MREIFEEIAEERSRQDQLADEGRWGGRRMATITDPERLAVLVEEMGEVAKAMQEDEAELGAELIQVAAVAVAWLEALDSPIPGQIGLIE